MMLDLLSRLGNNPTILLDIIQNHLDLFSFDLRCAAPAVVVSYDSSQQTVDVRLATKEILRFLTEKGYDIQSLDIDIIPDVPIVMPRAGNFVITFPVQEGDECLVVFADTCIDSWWNSGLTKNKEGQYTGQEPISMRRHDLSDAFAILGPWSQPNRLTSLSTTCMEIKTIDDANKIQIKDDSIKISINDTTYVEVKDGEITIKSTGTLNVEGTTVNVKGDSVVLADGVQGVARLGDTVVVDPSTHTGAITTASTKVTAG